MARTYTNKSAQAKMKMRRKAKKKQSTANQALQIAKKNNQLLKKSIERKHLNYVDSSNNVTTAGYAASQFMSMAGGVGDDGNLNDQQRIGNSVNLLSQRFMMNFLVSGTDNYNQIRVLIVEALEGNVQLQLSDVLQFSDYSISSDVVFISPWKCNPADNKKYKVHLDKTFELSGLTSQGSSGVGTKQIDYTVTFGKTGKKVLYPTASSSTDEPSNHRMHIFAISDSASVSHPSLSYAVRCTYLDA